jgi:hypothetical protein
MRRGHSWDVVEAAQHTWHQEPEQRPAGGTPGVLSRCLLPRRYGRSVFVGVKKLVNDLECEQIWPSDMSA